PSARAMPPGAGEGTVDTAPVLGSTIVGMRADRPVLTDPRVRRAIAAAAAEVGAAAERFGLGVRPPGRGGLLPPAMPGHTYNLPAPPTLDEARSLLADAGHPDGEGLPPVKVLAAQGVSAQAEA